MSDYRGFYQSGYRFGGGYRVGAYGNGSSSALALPGSPILWFDAQNIDGLGNSNAALTDGQQVGTWVNLGSLGTSANLTQATGALRPLFRKVATAGKINNLSAVQSDGTQWTMSLSFATQNAPNLHLTVWRATDFAQQGDLYDGAISRNILFFSLTTGGLNMYAGSAVTSTSQTVAAATWETTLANFQGATSWTRLNGAQSGNLNPGTGNLDRIVMFSDSVGTASTIAKCMIAEHVCWNGAAPSSASIEAYVTAKYGVTPA